VLLRQGRVCRGFRYRRVDGEVSPACASLDPGRDMEGTVWYIAGELVKTFRLLEGLPARSRPWCHRGAGWRCRGLARLAALAVGRAACGNGGGTRGWVEQEPSVGLVGLLRAWDYRLCPVDALHRG
jgi:hypothetical protein